MFTPNPALHFIYYLLVISFGYLSVSAENFSLEESFKTYCVECHGAKGKVKGEVNLLSLTQGEDIKSDPELLQTVMEVIDFREMPPEENQPIDNNERKMIVAELKRLLEESVSGDSAKWVKAYSISPRAII